MNYLIVYNKLLKEFGKQNWWPVSEKNKNPEYKKRIKLSEKQKLEIVFGTILTQNTSWKNAEKAIIELNKKQLIKVKKIANIRLTELKKLIKSSGYFNQKAVYLKEFCNYLLKKHNGNVNKLFEKNTKELRKELLSLKGIGRETADSIILYAARKPCFVVDAYTKRIFNRIGLIKNKDIKYDELKELIEKNIKKNVLIYNEFHALLVELGKNYCKKKKPKCLECVLKKECKKKNERIS